MPRLWPSLRSGFERKSYRALKRALPCKLLLELSGEPFADLLLCGGLHGGSSLEVGFEQPVFGSIGDALAGDAMLSGIDRRAWSNATPARYSMMCAAQRVGQNGG
jgi:hypothetical protein